MFDANGTDRIDIAVADIDVNRLHPAQILWVDCASIEAFDAVQAHLRIHDTLANATCAPGENSAVLNTTEHFWIRVFSMFIDEPVRISDYPLDIMAGRNVVITIQRSSALDAATLIPRATATPRWAVLMRPVSSPRSCIACSRPASMPSRTSRTMSNVSPDDSGSPPRGLH